MVLAAFGKTTLWMAVLANLGASLLVVFNELRLLRNTNNLTKLLSNGYTHAHETVRCFAFNVGFADPVWIGSDY
jgi:hypothetical protein